MSEAVDAEEHETDHEGESGPEYRRRMARMDYHIGVLRERQLSRRDARDGVRAETYPR